jgi:hypothetical protein
VARPGALRSAEVSSHHRAIWLAPPAAIGITKPTPRPATADGLSGLGDELCLDPLGPPVKAASQERQSADTYAQSLRRSPSPESEVYPATGPAASPHRRSVTSPGGRFRDGLLLDLLHGELTESW